MISTIFLLLIAFFLSIVTGLLGLLSFIVPVQIQTAIETAIASVAYFTGVLPVQNIMTAMLAFLTFLITWYGVKLAFMLFHMIPWVGKKIDIDK